MGKTFRDMFWRVARHVGKIFNGAKPAEFPVQPPITFDLVINVKAAKPLGLAIPPSVLRRADRVNQ